MTEKKPDHSTWPMPRSMTLKSQARQKNSNEGAMSPDLNLPTFVINDVMDRTISCIGYDTPMDTVRHR